MKKQPPGVLIHESRHLVPGEIVQVLEGSRQAIAGKTLRLAESPRQTNPEVIMGTNGRPRILRTTGGFEGSSWNGRGTPPTPSELTHVDVIQIVEFTGRRVRRCDGRTTEGELVLNYEHRTPPGQWTVSARSRDPEFEYAAVGFDMLAGVTSLESGEFRTIGGHLARAFVAPWTAPRNAIIQVGPRSGVRSLWIDIESLLPLRVSITGGPDAGGATEDLVFLYDPSIDIHTPEGVTAPDCIP